MSVKLADLPAWIGRRDKSIGAFYNEFMRNIYRVHNLYWSGPLYTPFVRFSTFLKMFQYHENANDTPLFSGLSAMFQKTFINIQ